MPHAWLQLSHRAPIRVIAASAIPARQYVQNETAMPAVRARSAQSDLPPNRRGQDCPPTSRSSRSRAKPTRHVLWGPTKRIIGNYPASCRRYPRRRVSTELPLARRSCSFPAPVVAAAFYGSGVGFGLLPEKIGNPTNPIFKGS
jgi:hypothetical protein